MEKKIKEIFFNNPDLLEKAKNAKDFEEVRQLLKPYVDVTCEDLKKIFSIENKTDSKITSLSDCELSNVNGGFSFKVAGDLIGAQVKHWFRKR